MSEENKKAAETEAAAKTEEVKAEEAQQETSTPTEEAEAPAPKTPKAKTTKRSAKKVEVEEVEEEEEDVNPLEDEDDDPNARVTSPDEDKDFDWDAYEDGLKSYGEKEENQLREMYADTLNTFEENEVVIGKVTNRTDREAIIDINSKSEGVVSLNEFRYNPDLAVGDEVEVLIDKQEDKNGSMVLSHRKARAIKAWDRVNEVFETEEIVQGYVKCRTKGGMIVDVFGIEAFLPGSQIDVKPIRDYDQYVDKTMEFKVVKINQEFKNVVVSHKALIEADLEQQKKEIISKLEKGQVLEGVVKNVTSYGVFIDLGGVDGLIHITDLSWSRINHPSEVVEMDEKLNVVILDFDEDKTRIQLGLKQLQKHPWEALSEEINIGDKVKGKVVVIADYGAFVEIAPGVEGLVHVSEMSWSTHLRSAQDFVKVGDEVNCQVLTLDREERKMSLGMKQLSPDPWTDITEKYPKNSQHKGVVRNFTNFGVFVELEEGIDGLIHISDLSWTKKVKHPADFTSIGEEMEVAVLDIDTENRRLSLGHKQLEENPWDTYQTVFTLNSVHEGEIAEVNEKGATVNFKETGAEGFVPTRHMKKEDETTLKRGESAEFKVIEFNKDNRKLVVSHTQIHRDVEVAEKKQAASSRKAQAKETESNMKKMASNNQKSTLGDLDVLSQLKSDLEEEEGKN
mgnify:CR=1 FL=1